MKISEIEASQNQTFHKAINPPPAFKDHKNRRSEGVDKASSQSDPVDLKTHGGSHAVRKLEAVNTVMNTVAKSIRMADDAMDEIDTTLQKMKSQLVGLIKQFPPYPPGSEERVKSLKIFSALRQQIDALSFSPDEGARALLSAPKNITNKEMSQVDFGTEEIRISLNRQPAHTGEDGLDIPDLPETAGDAELQEAVERIDQAFDLLSRRRGHLAADAERITRL